MDKVYIVYSVDANDETTIIRLFSNYESAYYFKTQLEDLSLVRKRFSLSVHDRLFIDSYVVYD